MAIVKRDTTSDRKKTKTKTPAPKTGVVEIELPTDRTEPITDLGGVMTLLSGEKKIGKTSLASMFGKNLVLAFEPGYKGLRIFKVDIPDWETARAVARALKKDKKFNTVTVDIADIAFKYCDAYVCRKLGIEHASEEDWGKGWAAIRKEFENFILALLATGKGVIIISHTMEKEVKTRSGNSYDRIMPTMPRQAREIVEGMVDLWAHYGYDGERRVLTILGDDHISAGHRFSERFRTPDGHPIRRIDMGHSKEEAYDNFMAAWNNKYEPQDEDDLAEDETPKKKKSKSKFKLG